MGTRSFPGVKQPGSGTDHPPPSTTEVKERVELYLYSTFGPSWPVLRVNFTFTVIGDITTVSIIQSEASASRTYNSDWENENADFTQASKKLPLEDS